MGVPLRWVFPAADLHAAEVRRFPKRVELPMQRENERHIFGNLPIQQRLPSLRCGVAVVDIRTIVECSPQLGQTETSS